MKAFPNVTGASGMELRDYFAAKVLAAWLSSTEFNKAFQKNLVSAESTAEAAYDWADVMMEARETE